MFKNIFKSIFAFSKTIWPTEASIRLSPRPDYKEFYEVSLIGNPALEVLRILYGDKNVTAIDLK